MITELQAARLRLASKRPYLATALWALQPVERPGLGTMAVDRWWRLYYDPAVASDWTVDELAGVLYHEVCHLLRGHSDRAEVALADTGLWNISTDAEINDDLLAEQIKLPGQPVTPGALGQQEGLLAEEYYAALRQQARPSPVQGASALDGGASATQSGVQGKPALDSGADGATAGPDGGDSTSPSSPTPSATSAVADVPSSPTTGPVASPTASDNNADGGTGGGAGGSAGTPAPGAGRCGSCAHGQRESWEDAAPGTTPGAAPGVDRAAGELIRRQVAEAIRVAASSGRGNIPGHWRRWAEDKLSPAVDWRRELASLVRHALADVVGAADYSYRRPSRRQAALPDVILPSLRQPVPGVAVVVDTSGSVGDDMLAQALAEVAGVLRATGQRQGVHVLAVDTEVQACQRVFRAEQVELVGGGGTDMAAGIAAALRLRPRPQVIIVLTDGDTPWPDTPPRNVRVVVGLLGDGRHRAPSWAKEVTIK